MFTESGIKPVSSVLRTFVDNTEKPLLYQRGDSVVVFQYYQQVMQQDTLIGYSSSGVHKQVIPENYRGTRSLSQIISMQIQERGFLVWILPFFY